MTLHFASDEVEGPRRRPECPRIRIPSNPKFQSPRPYRSLSSRSTAKGSASRPPQPPAYPILRFFPPKRGNNPTRTTARHPMYSFRNMGFSFLVSPRHPERSLTRHFASDEVEGPRRRPECPRIRIPSNPKSQSHPPLLASSSRSTAEGSASRPPQPPAYPILRFFPPERTKRHHSTQTAPNPRSSR